MSVVAGMIGLTHPHSAAHLRTLDALEMVDGVVLYDPDPTAGESASRLCRKTQAVCAHLPELLARRDVSVVVVALPTDVTPETIIQAVRAGKHIICEKPCGRSAGELRPVLETLAQHRVGFAVCYVWRANPAIERMRELVQVGALGRLTSVELRMVTTQVRFRDPAHWLFKRNIAGGGVLSWLGCHWIDLLRHVTGQEVSRVSATIGTLSGEAIDVEDVASVTLSLSGRALASLYAGYLLPFGPPGYEGAMFDQDIVLRGVEGTLRHERAGDTHFVRLHSTAPGWQTTSEQVDQYTMPPVPAYGGAAGLRFIEAFLRSALHGVGPSPASALDALRVLEILDGIYTSARTGRALELPG